MDSADKLVNNRAPKQFIILFVFILIFAGISGYFFSAAVADRIVRGEIRAVLAGAGGVDSDDFKFTAPEDRFVEMGAESFSGVGVDADLKPSVMSDWSGVRRNVYVIYVAVIVAVSLIWLIASLVAFGRLYDSIERIRINCTNIAWRTGSADFVTEDSGCIGSLSYAVNMMSRQYEFLEDRAAREQKALVDFLTDFSHQIKTSLSVVRLNTDMMLDMGELPQERREELAEEIEQNTDSMEKLVKSALRLARLNAGAVEYKMERLPLSGTCELAIKRLNPLLRSKGIEIGFHVLSPDTTLGHDRLWLCEAIENIIKNSADHSECTEINVGLEKTPTAITISVTDNGKGIPQSEIPRIFERFGRPHNDITMNSAGIGMSVAQKIVEAHNGEIVVFSEVGSGTRFDMIFV